MVIGDIALFSSTTAFHNFLFPLRTKTMLSQSSRRSLGEELSSTDDMGSLMSTRNTLQRESIEYDRRQIRRKMAQRMRERGEDLMEEDPLLTDLEGRSSMDEDEDESVYEDTEIYPWKQREAAVQAAAVGGKTEGRMEGFDSMERALQAHQHKLHYGRGKGFAWSLQQKNKTRSSLLLQKQRSMASQQSLTDWQSFRQLDISDNELSSSRRSDQATRGRMKGDDDVGDGSSPEEAERRSDEKLMRKTARRERFVHTLVLLAAVGTVVGFAIYMEILKIDTYQTYLPKQEHGHAAEPNTSQNPFVVAEANTRAGTEGRNLVLNQSNQGSGIVHVPPQQTSNTVLPRQPRAMSVVVVQNNNNNKRNTGGASTHGTNKGQTARSMQNAPHGKSGSGRLDALRAILLKHSKLDTAASQRAVDWLANMDSINLPSSPEQEARLVQRFALVTLYFATKGPEAWKLGSAVFFAQPSVPECQWRFERSLGVVECNDKAFVTKLILCESFLLLQQPPFWVCVSQF